MSIARITVAALVLAIALAPASSATDATWSPAVDLSTTGQSAESPQIKASSNGQYQTVVWRRSNGSNYIVQSRTSNDYGDSWAPALDLSAAGQTAFRPQIAMSADGRYQTATWRRTEGVCEIIQARTSSDYGATWAPVLDLTATGRCAYEPRVAMSADGRYQTITWYRGNGGYYIVQSSTSSDYGATWTTAINHSPIGQDSGEARVAMSADGRYQTITWYSIYGSDIIAQTRTSSDYGVTWSNPVDLSATGQTAFTLQIAMSTDGRYQTIIWRRSSGNNYVVQSTTSSDYGASWSTPVDLSVPGPTTAPSQVAMSSDGQHQTIIWTNSGGGTTGIQSRISNDYGATWATTLDLSAPGQDAGGSQVAISEDGRQLTATWYRSDGTKLIVQSRTSNDYGATWATAVDLSAPGQNASSPQIAMSADGRHQTIAWNRSNGSNIIIQVSQWGNPGVETSTTAARAIFRFVLPDGTECSAISPQVAVVGTIVTLPEADANCHTMHGSLVAGWTIPTSPDSTEYGSPSTPFGPGLPVRVVDSQSFTLVPYEPILTFTYDANVALTDTCASNAIEDTTATGRQQHVWVPRADITLAQFPTAAACTPNGVSLTGWNTRGDGSGTTYRVRDSLPDEWASSTVNHRTLYAVWK